MTSFSEKRAYRTSDILPSPISARDQAQNKSKFTKVLLIVLTVFCLLWLQSCHSVNQLIALPFRSSNKKVNIIFMISDGYGPASETFGRSFHQAIQNNTSPNANYKTPLDKILIGSHRSRSNDSLITDSAAGATAFSCGLKSYNGAIGVDAKGELCGTVLEGAKEQGWLTGVVVTSRLSDATPAAFFAHVASRGQESDIANEALGLMSNGTSYRDAPLDLAIGGGGCYFLPKSSPYSCRQDEQDLVGASKKKGWNTKILFNHEAPRQNMISPSEFHAENDFADTHFEPEEAQAQAFMEEDSELPLLALLAPFNTPYEIDRKKSIPPLHSLALKAINTLDRSPRNTQGFFVMIEGSQIDLCAHSNDPACHAREIAAYQRAIEDVKAWVDNKNKQGEKTILISTSDHETGGLTLGRQLTAAYPNYAYYPERLIPVQQSAASLSAHLIAFARQPTPPNDDELEQFVRQETLGESGAGFLTQNGGQPSDEEIKAVLNCIPQTPSASTPPPINTADICRAVIADLISKRVEVGWSTSGHTGVDVPVHASGPAKDVKELSGNIENTFIGTFIANQLGIDLANLTKRLKKQRLQYSS